ncbi:MAG: translational GTPase TypA [Rhodospirillales bacterium]|nr:translational GTPase TypA [Rhodospirillales bacterium]
MDLRNFAIIAHVDHGKTTLVDGLLRQTGAVRDNQQVAERALDSGDLERERGITILAKCTSVEYCGTRFNIVDTPGHADFGGEVERILSMVDGVLLLVDAAEGPMPQTKFVTGKALNLGLRPIVVINKVDRMDQRADKVLDEVFDLFAGLDADQDQLDFPVMYASAKEGWAAHEPDGPRDGLTPLFELIRDHVPPPDAEPDGHFAMLATTLEADPYLGRVLTGKIASGRAATNMIVKALGRAGDVLEETRLTKLLAFRGLERVPVESAGAGDIVALAGFQKATVADTLCAAEAADALEAQPIDPPTLAMTFAINDSPLAGTEGGKVTSRVIGDRLRAEAEGNVAIRVTETGDANAFEVAGRGELQLAVLIETMRREGFELSISRPRVVYREDEHGNRLEPVEEVTIDVDEEFSGPVVEKLGKRKAELREMKTGERGKQRLVFIAPSRALIGYHGEFMTDTRGTGVLNRVFSGYARYKGAIGARRNGVLVSLENGKAVAYALWNLEERGPMFIGAGEKVYGGMIIGEHNRGGDLEVNPLKAKQLTNIRAAGKDDAVDLTKPIEMTLDKAIAYIGDDELVEVTPESVRLRKRHLDPHERRRRSKKAEVA